MKSVLRPFVALLAVLSLLFAMIAGCGGGSTGSKPQYSSPSSITLPASGGTVTARSGQVQLILPAGAVAADQKITVSTINHPPDAGRIVSQPLHFTSTTFSTSIQLRLTYDASKLPDGTDETALAIYRLDDDNVWQPQPSVVNTADGSVTATIAHFSDYAILTPPPSNVRAEATIEGANTPAVKVSWDPNGFFNGSGDSGSGIARFQVYRSGMPPIDPALVVGNRSSAVDSSAQDNSEFPTTYFDSGMIGGTTCANTTPSTNSRSAPPLLIPETPYVYSVEAIYKVSSLDLPGGTSGGASAGGTAAGGTSSGSTSAGSSSGGTGEQECYFQTSKPVSGQATPLRRPTVDASSGTVSSGATNLTFTVGGNVGTSIPLEYVVEFSNDSSFPSVGTVRTDPFATSTILVDTSGTLFDHDGSGGVSLLTAPTIYYRVGVKNPTDFPGPVRDPNTGLRYIYSSPASTGHFDRT